MSTAPAASADPDFGGLARTIQAALPKGGLFANQQWHISPTPFICDAPLAKTLDQLGRVLLQFYRATNLLYRQSVIGKQPSWIAQILDQGKPARLIDLQRSAAFKNDLPRVIRPDLLLGERGFGISELDSVPGGIGVTAWLNQTYSGLSTAPILGGPRGMLDGFASIFGKAPRVHLVVSEESANYRPEMEWVAQQLNASGPRFHVRDTHFNDFAPGDAVYRFFELFDTPNIASAESIFSLAADQKIQLTPSPKPIFEEKLLFGLLWNRNLRPFWRQELGESFFLRLQQWVPYTWILDPAPLPAQGAFPELNLTDWQQLKGLSQRDRELVLKISGFSPEAWGSRGVYVGHDLSQSDWSAAIDKALSSFPTSPYVLQRFHQPRTVAARYFDFTTGQVVPMTARARLCPYYFVSGDGDSARATLGGVLATLVPADKKVVHGMRDAILVPAALEV